MNQELASITDMNALKAMAYDAIAAKEEAERHLGAINNRIRQLMVTAAPAAPALPTAGAAADPTATETPTPPATTGADDSASAEGSDGAAAPTTGQ